MSENEIQNVPNPEHSETDTETTTNTTQDNSNTIQENSNVPNPEHNERNTTNAKKINLLWNSVPCFVKFCLAYGMIPTSFRLAMTYEEQILWIGNFLQEVVIPSIEENGKAVEELKTAIQTLTDYINDLDIPQIVEDEIAQMIEDGDFDRIFAEYVDPLIDNLQGQIDDLTETIGNLNLPTVIDPETRRACRSSYGRNA